jgi:hypothetical protein
MENKAMNVRTVVSWVITLYGLAGLCHFEVICCSILRAENEDNIFF